MPHKHWGFSVSLCIFKNPRLAVFLHSILACFYRQFFALKISYGDVPKWLKGPDSKSGRSAPPAQEFKSLHLRHRAFIGAFTAFTAACKVRRVKALLFCFRLLGGFRPQGVFFFNRALNRLRKHLPFYSHYLYDYRYLPWLTCRYDLTNPVSSS